MVTKNEPENNYKFVCEDCDYKCFKNANWKRHISTAKHNKALLVTVGDGFGDAKTSPVKFNCLLCNKVYKSRNGLWAHTKKCKKNQEIICDDTNKTENENITSLAMEIIKSNVELQKQNSELQKQNNELQKQVLEICKNIQPNMINNHTINSHNKTFNLNMFLNEECKDAMNIMDFANSITLQLKDLEHVGSNGYVNGISSIILKELNELDITKRPVHCSDAKRETLYVKDEDKWEKECSENTKIKKAIRTVEKKNINLISKWTDKHPKFTNSTTKENDEYLNILIETMGGKGDYEKNKNKVVKNIAKEVVIDKDL